MCETFVVDGKARNFADIILETSTKNRTCTVASYGFGFKQVKRLTDNFNQVLLVADESHSVLNKKAYESVVKLAEDLSHFTFKTTKTHAKLAIVDNQKLIFTSANLSSNRRMESYLIVDIEYCNGIGKVLQILGVPQKLFKGKSRSNIWDEIFDFS